MKNRTCARCSIAVPEGNRWIAFFEFPIEGAPTADVMDWVREMCDPSFHRTAWCSLRCMTSDLNQVLSGRASR